MVNKFGSSPKLIKLTVVSFIRKLAVKSSAGFLNLTHSLKSGSVNSYTNFKQDVVEEAELQKARASVIQAESEEQVDPVDENGRSKFAFKDFVKNA